MADTIQVVSWALRQACRLRCGDAERDIPAAANATARAELYGRYVEKPQDGFGVFDDVLVDAHTYEIRGGTPGGFFRRSRPGTMYPYPRSGFVISHEFAQIGGPEGLRAMCGGCRANATAPRPAGCTGLFYQHPHAPQMQQQLQSILSRLRLAEAHAQNFMATNPIWFGLWTRSPLSCGQIDVLLPLLKAMLEEDSAESPPRREHRLMTHLTDLHRFIRALELSLAHELELHVTLTPPGHTDLGYDTTFPHCPLCKAQAEDVERWSRPYPTTPHTCRVCGTSFSPAATARSERMKDDAGETATDLRRVLGAARFATFARSYLIAHGVSEDLAARLVQTTEAREAEQRAKFQAEQRRHQRQMRFIRANLIADLHPTYGPDDDTASLPMFDAAEFAQVLARCRRMGIGVTFLSHTSQRPDHSGFENCRGNVDTATKVLAKWRKKGYDEMFGAGYDVPEALLPPE